VIAHGPPLHDDYAEALRLLAGVEIAYAEALRALIPVARRLGVPRPSYSRVRRFIQAERARKRRGRNRRDEIIQDLLAGLVKRPLWRATQT
jgi:hypothetical protein